jgi:hypothetical protein
MGFDYFSRPNFKTEMVILHDEGAVRPPTQQLSTKDILCRYYARGSCRYGKHDCAYKHTRVYCAGCLGSLVPDSEENPVFLRPDNTLEEKEADWLDYSDFLHRAYCSTECAKKAMREPMTEETRLGDERRTRS